MKKLVCPECGQEHGCKDKNFRYCDFCPFKPVCLAKDADIEKTFTVCLRCA